MQIPITMHTVYSPFHVLFTMFYLSRDKRKRVEKFTNKAKGVANMHLCFERRLHLKLIGGTAVHFCSEN